MIQEIFISRNSRRNTLKITWAASNGQCALRCAVYVMVASLCFCIGCTLPPEQFSDLTAKDCNRLGVAAASEVQTGQILISEFHTLAGVEDRCGETYPIRVDGCARAVDSIEFPSADHLYAIYYADHKFIAYHEACHALYETRKHTVKFDIAQMQR